MLTTIISGGQTGADMAGLLAARDIGLKTGGTAAPYYATSEGKQEELLKSFGLKAISWQGSWVKGYIERTKANVDNSDATVVFKYKDSPGTDKTIGYAVTGKWKALDLSGLNKTTSQFCKN